MCDKVRYYFGWFYGIVPNEIAGMINHDLTCHKSLVVVHTMPQDFAHNDETMNFTKHTWFEPAGVSFDNYHSIDHRINKEDAQQLLRDASAILFHGGSSDGLHAFISQYELEEAARESRASVIMGASAGGMNMAKRFAHGKWIDDNNREPASIFEGMGFNNFALQSHAVCTLESLAEQAHTKNYLMPLSNELDVYVACTESTIRILGENMEFYGDVYKISNQEITKMQ